MPLKAVLDSIEGLSNDVKTLYIPGNPENEAIKGKFILDVEAANGFVLDNVESLRNAFGKTKDELVAKTAALEGFKGLSASKVRESLKELDKLKALDPEVEADKLARTKIASAIEKAEALHAAELKEAADESDRLWGALNTALVSNQAKDAIIQAGGEPELLMPHVMSRTKVDRKTLQVSVFADDGSAQYRHIGNDVQPAGIADLVAELKANAAFGRAFAADKSGSGATGGSGKGGHGGAGGSHNPFAAATFNLTEQFRIMKADPARAAHLKALAAAR